MSRATLDRVRGYLTAMENAALADFTRAWRLRALSDALRVMAPGKDASFIGRAARRIARHGHRARDLRSRIRPPEEVLALGNQLMQRADEEGARQRFKRATLYRDGLLISLWVLRPVRLTNLTAIELDRHLTSTVRGWRLEFRPEETKSGRAFECSWPKSLTNALVRYLNEHRPVLLKGDEHRALWISQCGRPMTKDAVSQRINWRTKACFGEALNPHLMRHIVATSVAEQQPEQIADVAVMLGHTSPDTSARHYILARSYRAVATFQDVLARRIESSPFGNAH